MPDVEPTIGEVFRSVAGLREEVARLIGRAEYDAHRLATDQRINDLASDLLRMEQRFEAEKSQRQAQGFQTRLALFGGIVAPIVVALFMLFLQSQVGP